MYSEGTDSRCDNLVYDEGYTHIFGVFLASKGYCDYGDYKTVINGKIPAVASKRWEKVKELLKECGIKYRKPCVVSVTQVW